MLAIRKEQVEVFIRAGRTSFEDWMLSHVKRFFPKQSRLLSDDEIRATIRHGISRAAVYEIASQRDVCKYIDLLVVFGRDLDTDPRYPWAREILDRATDPESKVTALQQAAIEHLWEAPGDARF